ncbi:hypothetical protein [Mycolicibacterium sp. 624]|uniref:hypothetical protein n=1 Tax=Mycolicibacterium sp. 624 TaxID=3156314 RepID=UPI003391CA6C
MSFRAAPSAAGIVLLRLLAAVVLLSLIAAPIAALSVLPRAQAGEPGTNQFLKLRIDEVTPDIVSTTSEPLVTVSGTVANVGDRPVRDVVVRLEQAAAVTTSNGLRTNLVGDGEQYRPVADFITVAPELEEDQSVPFTLTYPIRSDDSPSLQVEEPGVYPVLVNVNGTPDYGAPARLDDARFLLPVLGVPSSSESANPVSSVVPPDTSRPVGVTMLWPLADKPRLAPGAPGGTVPVRLLDDDLATSLAPSGRLEVLLSAADFATSPPVDPTGEIRSALCLAVDPDLLVTVNAMTAGYVVVDSPEAGITGASRPGTGQDAAIGWLARLRALAQRMCVVSSVYAQADLTALQRVADPGLSSIATIDAATVVDQILGVQSVRGATLVADGPLTGPAVRLLSERGPTVAIAAAESTAQDSANSDAPAADLAPRRYTPAVVAAPFDPSVGAALAGAGDTPSSPSYLSASLEVPVQQDSPVARRQDAVGAMLWRGLRPDTEPRTEVLMPPLVWNLGPDDATAVLSTLATSIHAGLSVPRPLTAVIAESSAVSPAVDEALPDDSATNPRARFSDGVIAQIAGATARLWGLTAALTTDERTGLTGTQYTAPLREDMLRALSQSVPAAARNGLAEQRATRAAATVNDLFNAVTIVNPGGSYTLATERSPLPMALRNDLPVPIRVRLDVNAPPGMTVTDMGEIELPPGYLPLRVPIEVHFTQRVAVDVSLHTADGLPLGEPVRLSVHSNAYGKVLFFITLSAGAVLFLLAGRRLWHRFRGQPDRADLDRPPGRTAPEHPDPLDVAIAHAPDDKT